MTNLRKRTYLQFQATPELLRRAGIAACLASRKRQERVEEGPLAREFTLAGVDAMLASATPEERAQAEADFAEREQIKEARKAKQHERTGVDRRQQQRRTPVGAS